MATLVTGGTGFVGSNIVKVLAQQGHEVVSVDIAPPDEMVRRYTADVADRIAWVQGDILNRQTLSEAVDGQNIDKIIHAAVYTGTRPDVEKADSHRIVDINTRGTLNLLDLARQLSVKRFVYVSSGGVYAGKRLAADPLREDMALFPINLYDITKYACEMLSERYGNLHGFETASVRLSAPYGPMERVTGHRAVMSQVYEWTGSAMRGEAIDFSRVTPDRDFTYVLDTASAITAVLDAPSLKHQVYNIARGRKVTLGEMIDAMQRVCPSVAFTGSRADVEQAPAPKYGRGPMDVSRLKDLGFVAEHDVEMGLRKYMAWRTEFGFRD